MGRPGRKRGTKNEKKTTKRKRVNNVGDVMQRLMDSVQKSKKYVQTAHLLEDPSYHSKKIYVEMACRLQGKMGGLLATIIFQEWDIGTLVSLKDICKQIPKADEYVVQRMLIEQCRYLGLLMDETAVVFKFDEDHFLDSIDDEEYKSKIEKIKSVKRL